MTRAGAGAPASGSARIQLVRPWSGGVLVPSVNHTTTPPWARHRERTTRTLPTPLLLVGRTRGRPKSVPTTSLVRTGSPPARLVVETVVTGTFRHRPVRRPAPQGALPLGRPPRSWAVD